MNLSKIFLKNNEASFKSKEIKGELVTFENESYYKISNSDAMRPFFMSIVSDSNHWMFISSNGGLTAGRKDSESALFPYYTDDKITESAEITGSKTILQIHQDNKSFLWEPFSSKYEGIYDITRNLYKNSYGNKIVFEEINQDLGLTFRYQWNSSNQFGFVKKSTLLNHSTSKMNVTVLDGLQNILPSGVNSGLQNSSSNLVDAYKKCELQSEVGLGVYALSAFIVDKAEPSESLKANIVWSIGLENPTHLISSLQLNTFRQGKQLTQEVDIKAEKGAYFISKGLELKPNEDKNWMFIANVNQSITGVNYISKLIKTEKTLMHAVQDDIDLGTQNLVSLNAAADGLQISDDALISTRHFANSLFNIMRGGIFDNNYQIEKIDFVKYIEKANKDVFNNKQTVLKSLPEEFGLNHLKQIADNDKDQNFKRLCFEYLPLKFSRRHGDPSRPWNRFSINTRSEIDGSKILDYQGNWRDIFQNWEALAHSYPEFIESMIHKFLNATTFDGYNPYRVTKDGFDWEVIEEDDPWSYIGYWGDHQIIYLLKFLEFIEDHYPNELANNFNKDIFVYANVPYKIKTYQETLQNPKDTIDFDFELNHQIDEKRAKVGADGALMASQKSDIYQVNLMEKLLATVLAKVSNFIPEAGIWLNTQRPEWNDANNALVGNGVSMVTLCYLRRFLSFFDTIVSKATTESVQISQELTQFFNEIISTLDTNKHLLSGKISDKQRKTILDGLGEAGSKYRSTIYKNGFSSNKANISKSDLLKFISTTKLYIDHTIKANKRGDNLYHAYNLMTVENKEEVSISYLSVMLEGQVAALSSGYLTSQEALDLLDGLKASALFRDDQYSYILYPNKDLPRFDKKNNIPSSKVEQSDLLKQLIKGGDNQIIEKDVLGGYHFNGNFHNAKSLKEALSNLPKEQYQSLVEKDSKFLLDVFEDVFNHKAFTGRSGTFFGYEGLGSIYWHMVSKLLLAVQESCLKAINDNENDKLVGKLLDHYYEIEAGIGVHKSPSLYGAIPTDPYSHTPEGKGAQQPGMTGQVKEDILSRIGELGVFVKDGKLMFKPSLLRKNEFLRTPKVYRYVDVNQNFKDIALQENSLAFTYCQIPIIYKIAKNEHLKVVYNNGSAVEFESLSIDVDTSRKVFGRSGEINQIIVSITK
jgi:predicted site-specific integrase-resolvase